MINPLKRSLNDDLVQRLNTSYNGTPWHGKSVLAIVSMSSNPLPIRVLQLLNHMIAWRNFVKDALQGEPKKIKLNTEADWPPVSQSQEEILLSFDRSQSDLLEAIINFSEQSWHQKIEDVPYTWYDLCNGVIDHDIYHSGQIAISIKEHS